MGIWSSVSNRCIVAIRHDYVIPSLIRSHARRIAVETELRSPLKDKGLFHPLRGIFKEDLLIIVHRSFLIFH